MSEQIVRNDNPDRSNKNQPMVAPIITAIEIHRRFHRMTSAAKEKTNSLGYYRMKQLYKYKHKSYCI